MKNCQIGYVLLTVAGFSGYALSFAHAQSLGANGIHPVVGRPTNQAAPPSQPPSGLPGARAPIGGVAPPQVLPSDLSPNDALFDAINRGDILTARDAMNRGADLGARNILGMTPLELSVDLGRNDITFFLLSLRGAESPAPAPKQVVAKPVAPVRPARPARVLATQHLPPKPTVPAQFASGGTADPAKGFLGFGGTATP
jgi:hypothetical protein